MFHTDFYFVALCKFVEIISTKVHNIHNSALTVAVWMFWLSLKVTPVLSAHQHFRPLDYFRCSRYFAVSLPGLPAIVAT